MTATVLTNENFTISGPGMYQFADNVFEITDKQGGKYSGVFGTKTFRNWDKNGVRMLVGAEYKSYKKVVIPCGHSDNSSCHGEHKTVAISANSMNKKHRSIMKALSVLNDFLGYQNGLSIQVNEAWYNFKTEQERIAVEAEAARIKRETERKEAEAKKQAEAEAKKQAERIETIKKEREVLLSFGMSAEQVKVMLTQKYGTEVLSSVL